MMQGDITVSGTGKEYIYSVRFSVQGVLEISIRKDVRINIGDKELLFDLGTISIKIPEDKKDVMSEFVNEATGTEVLDVRELSPGVLIHYKLPDNRIRHLCYR